MNFITAEQRKDTDDEDEDEKAEEEERYDFL